MLDDTLVFINNAIQKIRDQVGTAHVVAGTSGGVDSTVCAVLTQAAIGLSQMHPVFIDTGLMRKDEAVWVENHLRRLFGKQLTMINAEALFLHNLAGVTNPESKRYIIGHTYIQVFENAIRGLPTPPTFLLQGTIAPDVIEVENGIKTHHNTGGLPEKMNLKLLEPVRDLFKLEVRKVAEALGIEEDITLRQPFPGPGLAVRCLRPVTKERLDKLRTADAIFNDTILEYGMEHMIEQSFAVLLPLLSTGIVDGARAYGETIALRAIHTKDFVTAEWAILPNSLIRTVSHRITDEIPGINRVMYDVTDKPPATDRDYGEKECDHECDNCEHNEDEKEDIE